MNTQFLKYFKDAFELKSIALCAKKNSLSSAAISKGIKSLESSLGFELIKHQKNKLIFTKNADLIYKKSLDILDKVDALLLDNTQLKEVRIGILHSLATGLFAPELARLAQRSKIRVLIANPTEVKNLLSSYQVDFAITIKRNRKLELTSSTLHKGSFRVIESSNSLTRPKKVIYTTPLWPEVETFLDLYRNLVDMGFSLSIVDSWDVIYALVKDGNGYGLLPDYFLVNNKKVTVSSQFNFSFPYSIVLEKQNSYIDQEVLSRFERVLKS